MAFSLPRQSQHFNYTWMRTIRQQDLCVASVNTGVALQPCDNTKAELRWYHKSSDSSLVGSSVHLCEPLAQKRQFVLCLCL